MFKVNGCSKMIKNRKVVLQNESVKSYENFFAYVVLWYVGKHGKYLNVATGHNYYVKNQVKIFPHLIKDHRNATFLNFVHFWRT